VLGHLYGPGDGKDFDGVIGKDLSNPIPAWAEHSADRQVVPYTVATDMDSPNPDSGEEYYHTNTQLYGVLDEPNRFKLGEAVTAPWNAPPPGAVPTMDGFVADYISTFTGEMGRQPTYEEYAHIMTGCTPEQLPVLNGIARDFGVFDHWFCEVPSQTFMNRSFWTAATSSGFVVNSPMSKWFAKNDAETLFDRLENRGRTWKVYVMEPVNASSSTVILARMLRRASCASTFGSRSPATRAASMSRPETPKMSAMTALSLMQASSSSFSARCFSAVRAATRPARYRVRSRSLRIGGAARNWAGASAARRPCTARPRRACRSWAGPAGA
jgi:hypothetical protein